MESGVGPTVELNSLDDRIRIRDAIQNGRIQEATALINQLHPELLDNDRYLYFHLQVNKKLCYHVIQLDDLFLFQLSMRSIFALIIIINQFILQQLHLIELIRSDRVEEALAFAQSHLSEAGESDSSVLTELERTLALLAFEDPAASPFGDLLQPAHRQKVFLFNFEMKLT